MWKAMQNQIDFITQSFKDFLKQHYNLSAEQLHPINLALNCDPQKQKFGDLSSNAAMMLAKPMGKAPRAIAQEIIDAFKHPHVEKIEVAGPGFLNLFLTRPTFVELAAEINKHGHAFFKPADLKKEKVSVEFVSANPTGPLHIGHGRGGIIGDVLGNVLKFIGHDVCKEFYINDAGSQLHKLGLSLQARVLQQLGHEAAIPEGGYEGEYLIDIAKELVSEHGKSLVDKPIEYFAVYAKDKLLAELKETLKDYGIQFDVWFSEKSLHDNGSVHREIQALTTQNHTYEKDGAIWFKSTEFGDDKDRVLKKANGELTYVASDIAYMDNKLKRGFNHIIMILGQDHHSYVSRLKGLMQAMGHNPEMLDVILYQLVTLKASGAVMRMSKRAGRIVSLRDVIDIVGKDVARFFYLHRKADAHLDFDVDLALKRSEENPVYYLQYAYVRLKGIAEKAKAVEGLTPDLTAYDMLEHEQLLLKKIIELRDILAGINRTLQPHLLTYYVLELAQAFHHYYAHNRVIDQDNLAQSRMRLAMMELLRGTFELALDLLGISKPEKM